MPRRTYIVSYLILAVLLSASGPANAGDDDCMELLKAIYAHLQDAPTDVELNQTYYADYTVKTVTVDSATTGPFESRVQILMQGERIRIISKEMEVYQDEKEVFTVIPMHKTLMRSDKVPGQDDYKKRKLQFFQDTLFTLSEVSYCAPIKLNNGTGKRVILHLSSEGRKLLSINSIVFDIDERKGQIQKVRVNYTNDYHSARSPLSRMVYVEYTIHSLETKSKRGITAEPVVNLFFEKKGVLKESYQDYEFMDARYKSNKSILNQYGG